MEMMSEDKRRPAMQARPIGPRMVACLEEIGISRLSRSRGAEGGE